MMKSSVVAVVSVAVCWLYAIATGYCQAPSAIDGATHASSAIITPCETEHSNAIPYHFDICLGNHKIGEYTTVEYRDGDIARYCAESVVRLWFFGQVEVRYTMECAYRDSTLLYSTCVGYKNGKERLRAEVVRSGDEWIITYNGESRTECEPITSSVVKLYYGVPEIGVMSIVESTLVYKEIIGKEGDTYFLKEPGKRGVTEMFYHNGEIARVNVHFPILNFNVVRQMPGTPECKCVVDELQ